jgi:hypothetical protein
VAAFCFKNNIMKVKFVAPMAGKEILYNTEDIYELKDAQAKKFIEHGLCVKADQDVKESLQKARTVIKAPKASKKKAQKK